MTLPSQLIPVREPIPVRRAAEVLHADPARVVTKLFLPGQEILARGISRADAVMQRVLAMSEDAVVRTLTETETQFAARHRNLRATFAENFELVAHRLPDLASPSGLQRLLIGAYCTQEYSVEAAALFNPSMVADRDQTGLAPDVLRFVMSVRAVGEGHISSIEFRTGTIGPHDTVIVDDPGRYLATGHAQPATMSREFLRRALADRADADNGQHLLGLLPEQFTSAHVETAIASIERDRLTRGSSRDIVEQIRWMVSCHYRLHFDADRPISERVIMPVSPDESNGVEDARFTRFVEDDGHVTYYATYTAFDGSKVAPHLLHTEDFQNFHSEQLTGPAAKDKGMALFPRRIKGNYVALSRWDRESIGVASSPDARIWGSATTVQTPSRPWELIQLGNCGPPLETPAGWLVLTHGVGPMREYAIGAILLDLDEPTRLIGALSEPLLRPEEGEREGYVPNVVYSCGGLLHNGNVVVPYGCSDAEIRFAFLDLEDVLGRLLEPAPTA